MATQGMSTQRTRKPTEAWILGVRFDNVGVDDVIAQMDQARRNHQSIAITITNVDCLAKARADQSYRQALNESALSLADSAPVIWASYLLGSPLRRRVPGSDLTRILCGLSAEKGYRLFFLGAAPGVAEQAKNNVEQRHPGAQVVGIYSPERHEILNDSPEIIRRVNTSGASILLVAFGAPFQEEWIFRNLPKLQVDVAVGVGSSLDYLAGNLRRAPRWMFRLGLEWLFRLLQEPRRLFRRYLIDDMKFFPLLMKEICRRRLHLRSRHAKD
jgi:N-acetylglucosaminyldiphosphoundecaprenol N-acetyl-beta-D-mannosaminyltransferase